jgi:hypothetical protein
MLQPDHATSSIGHAIRLVVAPAFVLAGVGGLLFFLREIQLATALIESLDRSASDL